MAKTKFTIGNLGLIGLTAAVLGLFAYMQQPSKSPANQVANSDSSQTIPQPPTVLGATIVNQNPITLKQDLPRSGELSEVSNTPTSQDIHDFIQNLLKKANTQ